MAIATKHLMYVPGLNSRSTPLKTVVSIYSIRLSPAAGAGNLETKGSKDLYTFTVPTGGKTLSISWVTCLSIPANPYANGLTWRVTSVASGAKVAGDYCASGNKTLTLAAGDYRLEMGSDITRNSYGTYSFRGVLNG